ncbi:MAG: hypothetical protein ACTHK4_10470 [Mycobacteriales bacterium]
MRRRIWGSISRRLPPRIASDIYQGTRAVQLVLHRGSGRRVLRSPYLYEGEMLRQRFERRRVPGMTTLQERAYYMWHTQEVFTGQGAIVDLGSFFGSTTATLAMGLRRNRRPAAAGATIDTYDRFVWEREMDYHPLPARLGPYEPGASFRREFDLVVRRWADRIRVHEGDLLKEAWDGPIELLLVDAMKSWDLATHIGTVFYPAMMAGDGYVIHQDFSHCFTPWIPLTTYRLRDHLEVATDIVGSEAVVFRLRRPFNAESLPDDMSRASYDEAEIEAAFDHWIGVCHPMKHSGLRTARVLLAHYDGDDERAGALRKSFQERGLLNDWHQRTLGYVLDA